MQTHAELGYSADGVRTNKDATIVIVIASSAAAAAAAAAAVWLVCEFISGA